ncbi:retroviral-like aspartic protease 1 [Saccostrea cucullata]|uniref:retroviral-like aspartic protease 1 n=1 Tax=Saccostrea cuccullata TaxID=36930 RepID=UPI002ED634D2
MGVGSSIDEAGMYIEISVQGVQAKFLIDTGATLTLLFSTMYEKIAENTRPKLQKINQSILAANGSELSIKDKTDLTLNIEGVVLYTTAVIAEIQADGKLGLDFLLSNACTVDMSERLLHILKR